MLKEEFLFTEKTKRLTKSIHYLYAISHLVSQGCQNLLCYGWVGSRYSVAGPHNHKPKPEMIWSNQLTLWSMFMDFGRKVSRENPMRTCENLNQVTVRLTTWTSHCFWCLAWKFYPISVWMCVWTVTKMLEEWAAWVTLMKTSSQPG